MTKITDTTLNYIEEQAQILGLKFVDAEFKQENGTNVFRVYIYRENPVVDFGDCKAMTKAISDYLETAIAENYNLEISSPGLDKKIKTDREYAIFKNKPIIVKTKETTVAGILVSKDDEFLKIIQDGEELTISMKDIKSVKLNLI